MPNLPFTLRQLEIFASLANTRSFRRSADSFGISQASVSNQLKTLEAQLGVQLFDRKPGRRPSLTAAGLAFQDDLRVFNRAAEGLASHRRAQASDLEASVRFRVLVGQGMFDTYVRPKLDRFFAANPTIELEMETRLPYGSLIEAIDKRTVDFALINQRADLPMLPQFHHLATVRGGLYGHRKFAEGRTLPLDPEFISTLPFIMPQAGTKMERQVLRAYEASGILPRQVIGHTQYFDVMAAMLDRGLGIASFSDAILPAAMRKDVIMLRQLEDWRLLYYRKDSGTDPRRDAVEEFLISAVVEDPAYPAVEVTR